MKNMKIIALLAVLLVSVSFMGAVSAADTTRNVSAGDNAFVFETINVTGTLEGSVLTKFSEGSNPTAVNVIYGTGSIFDLYESVVNGQYGTYYATANYKNVTNVASISIWYPELIIKAELTTNLQTGATSGDSVEGKTINKNTNVTFLVDAPKVGPSNNTGFEPKAKIVFTTPAGGKTTDFGTANFDGIPVNRSQVNAGYTAPVNAEAGTWTAQAEFTEPTSFKDYAKKSNTVSFTVQSTSLTLTAAKDSVVRSNPFTVTIQGNSQAMYFIYLDGASETEINPFVLPGQSGVKVYGYNSTGIGPAFTSAILNGNHLVASHDNLNKTWGYFETDASGKRVVQYNTEANTEDKTYTVKVYAIDQKYSELTSSDVTIQKGADYDSVKVKVEKGAVTITASGDGAYFIGAEIKLTGTNTDSSKVFLFITGQNLDQDGLILKALPAKEPARNATTNQFVAVKTDNTWEYKWDTSRIALDTGAYTIYATSTLTNGKSSTAIGGAVKLSDSEYATVSVNLKQPFLSAIPSGTTVAKGDKIYIRGVAEGDPKNLNLYIFGPNFFEPYSITVESDGKYEKKIEIPSGMSSNQYFVVIQHPMYNGIFDAKLVKSEDDLTWTFETNKATTGGDSQAFVVKGTNKLQGSQAADALTKMIDSANIDDIYTKLTFTVAEPWIKIASVGDQAAGTKFTISGTTNLAVDDQILVEVMSSSFTPTDKTSTSTTSGVSTTTKVVVGEGTDNKWSIDVDSTNWKLDEYTVKVGGIEVDITTTTNFNLVEKIIVTPTATASGATTIPTTATTTPTTPPTPGFGAFVALAGLGAVALLVLRRN